MIKFLKEYLHKYHKKTGKTTKTVNYFVSSKKIWTKL